MLRALSDGMLSITCKAYSAFRVCMDIGKEY